MGCKQNQIWFMKKRKRSWFINQFLFSESKIYSMTSAVWFMDKWLWTDSFQLIKNMQYNQSSPILKKKTYLFFLINSSKIIESV